MKRRHGRIVSVIVLAGIWFAGHTPAWAAEQVWNDAGINNLWNLSTPNWDADAAWQNGNTAVFSGGGGTVEVDAAVTVGGLSFQTGGYTVADADKNGSLAVAGAPSLFNVVNAGTTATVSVAIGGTGGFTKTGAGTLQLAQTNTYAGETRVSQGILRMAPRAPNSLGATGAGNGTVVENGAALDINGATPNGMNSAEPISLAGAGPDGQGALVNRGTGCMNSGFTGGVTLLGDTTVGCFNRIDVRSTWSGGGYTLTKIGGSELAVGNAVNNCAVVINAGNYTYMHANALGGTDFGTTLNGGGLRSYSDWTCYDHLTCNGGNIIAAGSTTNTFRIAGRVTLNGRISVYGENNNMSVELAGPMDGPGGFTRASGGSVYVTGNSNTYSGATIISATLFLGRTNTTSGVFGSGPVTNTSNLYIDRGGSFVSSNGFFGSGNTAIRYGGEMIVSGSHSSNSTFRIASGTLTLTNDARFVAYGRLYLAERTSGAGYPVDPTNVTATLNLRDGTWLETYSLETGNGNTVAGGGMTGTVNQTGGTLRTTGWSGDPANFPGEYDGLRIAHYPQAIGTYNLSGGTVIVDNGYRLAITTDGQGWLRQTGGEVYATEVVVNARNGNGGYGRLTLSGGVLNVGSNGITAGVGAPCLIEFGGGVVRALTNTVIAVTNTLHGAGAEAVTFDTQSWAINITSNMTGAGGFNKSGAGTLTLSGRNTYAGPARVLEGRLVRGAPEALPDGGEVLLRVTAADDGGRLHSDGDLSLAGVVLGVANPEELDTLKTYTVATYGGTLTAGAAAHTLPAPWYVYHDPAVKCLQIKANIGTVFWMR